MSVLLGLEFISETSVNTVLFAGNPLEVDREGEGREREREWGWSGSDRHYTT
jgi:hypothetical protein